MPRGRPRVYGPKHPGKRFLKRNLAGPKLSVRQKAQVKKLIGRQLEHKHFDVATAAAQIDRAGQITLLSAVTQGDGVQTRDGDQLNCKQLELRLNAWYVIGATQSQHAMRAIVFRWNIDTSISTPTLGSILAVGSTINDINAPYDFNALKQRDFTVLMDRTYSLGSTSNAVAKQYFIPLKSKIDFDPASTNGAGHIYLLLIGDDVTGAHTPDINAQFMSRLNFTDA